MKIPVIYTAHDYHLLTPNVTFFNSKKNCEFEKSYDLYNRRLQSLLLFKAVFRKCVKNSYTASFVASFTLFIQYMFRIYQRNVDCFITPSLFMRNKLLEYGFDKKKVRYIPNFLDTNSYKRSKDRNKKYILFFGLFHEHKGVKVLLQAAKKLPKINFRIAGSGSDEYRLKKYVINHNLKNVRFLEYLDSEKLKKEISSSLFCVVPSLWYENMPYSVLEAFALGKPVIASRIGGIPEIVDDGINGILFKPGNVMELTRAIQKLYSNPKLSRKMGIKARLMIEEKFNPEIHYQKLMKIYKKAIRDK